MFRVLWQWSFSRLFLIILNVQLHLQHIQVVIMSEQLIDWLLINKWRVIHFLMIKMNACYLWHVWFFPLKWKCCSLKHTIVGIVKLNLAYYKDWRQGESALEKGKQKKDCARLPFSVKFVTHIKRIFDTLYLKIYIYIYTVYLKAWHSWTWCKAVMLCAHCWQLTVYLCFHLIQV